MLKKNALIPIILCALLALTLGLIVAKLQQSEPEDSRFTLAHGTALNPGKVIQPFNLVDHRNQPFTLAQLQGQWTVLFFGFTNCPDICPVTMQLLKSVKKQLLQKQAWNNIQVGFVTVDPERDTVEQLSNYVPHFDPDFIGVTGSIENIQQFAKQMSMPFQLEEPNERGHYNVAHSASILLVSPDAKLRGIFSAPHQMQSLVSDLLTLAQ